MVDTEFHTVRFHGDVERATGVTPGITPMTGDDIAEIALFAATRPRNVQIGEITVTATHQASADGGSSVMKRRSAVELTIYTEGFFDAAHYIERHAGSAPACMAHTWKICVWVRGMIPSLITMGFCGISVLSRMSLSDMISDSQRCSPGDPTAELLVKDIYENLKAGNENLRFKVRVYENIVSRESWCEGGDFS
jgi:6-pyruvoyl-tetrahydropterin synthase